MRTPLPSLDGVAQWINGGEPSTEDLAGRPVFVQFWSISCYICHDVAEQTAKWRDEFSKQGIAFIAVHQPRGPEELDADKVTADAQGAMGLTQPCAIDSAHTIVGKFQNQFVPAYYVFDREHNLRHFQAGDKGYDRIENALRRVLEDAPAEATIS